MVGGGDNGVCGERSINGESKMPPACAVENNEGSSPPEQVNCGKGTVRFDVDPVDGGDG
jgi:hypothetical protein